MKKCQETVHERIRTVSGDLLNELEAVRLVCQETGCAQRYLAHDALHAIGQVSARIDDACGTLDNTARFLNYLHRVPSVDANAHQNDLILNKIGLQPI